MRSDRTGDSSRKRPTYFGKYPGQVLDNAPQEGVPPGALLVELQTFQEDDPASPGTTRKMRCKAIPCMPAGSFILPDIGAPVWVEFAAGDPRYPLWSGAFYSAGAAPLTPKNEAPTQHQRMLRSVAGNVVLLDDSEDSVRIVLHQQNGNSLTMSDDGIVIKCGLNTISLTSEGLTINAAGNELKFDPSGVKLKDEYLVLAPLYQWVVTHQHAVSGTSTAIPFSPLPPFPVEGLSSK